MSELPKKVLLRIGIIWLLLLVASILYYRSFAFFPFAIGASLGAALNIVKVIMLDRGIQKAITMEAKDAANLIRLMHYARLLLTGLVLFIAAVVPFINIWGAAAGVLTLQVATFSVKHHVSQEESETKSTDPSQSGGD